MKQSMDLFGKVLSDYFQGKRKDKFYFLFDGKKSVFDISYYFKGLEGMSELEKKMLKLVKGLVLDVGCGVGRHILVMQKECDVLGLDISAKNIEVAKQRGVKNCIVGNFFDINFDKKFDTITFFENGLGMAATIDKVAPLISKAVSLLNEGGQILTIGRFPIDRKSSAYNIASITPVYKDKEGPTFDWIHLSPEKLKEICNDLSLKYTLLGKEYSKEFGLYYLVRITR